MRVHMKQKHKEETLLAKELSEPITQLQSSNQLIPIEYVNDDKDTNEKQNMSIHKALNGVAE